MVARHRERDADEAACVTVGPVGAPGVYSERSISTASIRTARITAGSAASDAAARIVSDGTISMPGSVPFTS